MKRRPIASLVFVMLLIGALATPILGRTRGDHARPSAIAVGNDRVDSSASDVGPKSQKKSSDRKQGSDRMRRPRRGGPDRRVDPAPVTVAVADAAAPTSEATIESPNLTGDASSSKPTSNATPSKTSAGDDPEQTSAEPEGPGKSEQGRSKGRQDAPGRERGRKRGHGRSGR